LKFAYNITHVFIIIVNSLQTYHNDDINSGDVGVSLFTANELIFKQSTNDVHKWIDTFQEEERICMSTRWIKINISPFYADDNDNSNSDRIFSPNGKQIYEQKNDEKDLSYAHQLIDGQTNFSIHITDNIFRPQTNITICVKSLFVDGLVGCDWSSRDFCQT